MIDAPLALAFHGRDAGHLQPVRVCHAARLLVVLLGGEGRGAVGIPGGVALALRAGAAVTAGFAAVFGVAGVAITGMSLSVQRYGPWATLIIGLALVPLGVVVAAGRAPKLSLPHLQRGGSSRGLGSMALFGVSFATVSLSCTLPVFLAAVSTTFSRQSAASGLAVFGAYAAGMGVVLTALAVAVALSRQGIIRRLRGAQRYVERASGLLLAAAGAYVAWYGWVEVRLAAGADVPAGPVDTAGRLSGRISTWITDVGALRLGLAAAVLVAVAFLAERRRRSRGDCPVRPEPRADQCQVAQSAPTAMPAAKSTKGVTDTTTTARR